MRTAFIEQMVESVRRIRYVSHIQERDICQRRRDPQSSLFDPLKAAILHHREGDIEEAIWLVFLSVHFGKHGKDGWRLIRDVYGRLGSGSRWDWHTTSGNPDAFQSWLEDQQQRWRNDGIFRRFGNHRKFETLKADPDRGTGAVVESYVRWVNPPRTQADLIQRALERARGHKREAFDILYRSMAQVMRFGRLARFDFLTMLGKLRIAPIEPGSVYMRGANGPIRGARLLFGKELASVQELDEWLVELEADLGLHFGMQVLEDALCNWQKSPRRFVPFRS